MAGNLVVKCKGLAQRRDRQHNHATKRSTTARKRLFKGVAPTPNASIHLRSIQRQHRHQHQLFRGGGWFQNDFGQNINILLIIFGAEEKGGITSQASGGLPVQIQFRLQNPGAQVVKKSECHGKQIEFLGCI